MLNVARLLTIPATLTRVVDGVERDELNHPVETTETVEVRCWVHPEQGDETTAGADTQTWRFLGYFPPDTTLTGWDRLTLGAAVYELVGPPEMWTHPLTGADEYQTARLVRTI